MSRCPEEADPRRQEAVWQVPGAGVGGAWGVTARRACVSFWSDGSVLELESVDSCEYSKRY